MQKPTNTNPLQTTKFVLTMPRISNTQYFCQKVNLPGVTIGEAMQNTPFVDLYRAGDKLSYETFNVSFIVDEDLASYMEIHNWMKCIAFPENFEQYRHLKALSQFTIDSRQPQYAEGSLIVLSNLNNPKFRFDFVQMWPTSLSGIDFSTMDTEVPTITADVTFRFAYYTMMRF